MSSDPTNTAAKKSRLAINPVGIRMPPDLLQLLKESAHKNSRSVTAELVHRLQSTFDGTLLNGSSGPITHPEGSLTESEVLGTWMNLVNLAHQEFWAVNNLSPVEWELSGGDSLVKLLGSRHSLFHLSAHRIFVLADEAEAELWRNTWAIHHEQGIDCRWILYSDYDLFAQRSTPKMEYRGFNTIDCNVANGSASVMWMYTEDRRVAHALLSKSQSVALQLRQFFDVLWRSSKCHKCT